MKYFVTTVLTLLLGFSASWAQSFNQLVSRNLSSRDGLSSNQVYDMLQDKRGYLWFATTNGISRYDGYSFLNFNVLNAPLPKPVQASMGRISYDPKNDLLWATTSNFHVACYSMLGTRFLDYTGKGDYQRQYMHCRFDNGITWLYDRNEGIRRIEYANGQFVCTDFNRQNGHAFADGISSLYLDARHHAWVISKDGLYYLFGNQAQLKVKGKVVTGQRVDDKMAFFTNRGVFYLFDAQGKLLRKKDMKSLFPGNFAVDVKKSRASISWNHKWVLFTDKATFALDIQTLEVTKPADWQMQDALLLEQSHGCSFVSSKKGDLIIFSPQGIYRRINLLEGVKDQGNRSRKYGICAMSASRYLIVSYGNGAFMYDINLGVLDHIKVRDERHLIQSDFLTSALVDRNGNIWISQDEGGVVCISKSFNSFMNYLYPSSSQQVGGNDNAVMRILYDAKGMPHLFCKNKRKYPLNAQNLTIGSPSDIPYGIYTSYKDSKGHFWEGTRGGGLYVDGKLCLEKGKGDELTINDIYSIAEDKMGRIWLATIRSATDGGVALTRYQGARYQGAAPLDVQRFLFPDPSQNSIHYFCIDSRGLLWLATSGGLSFVDTREKNVSLKSFHHFNMANGKFPCNDLIAVRCTSRGDIWVGGIGSGLIKCRYDARKDELTYTQYTTENGLGSNNVYSILEDPSGNIWAGTENGLARVDIRTGRIDNNVLNDDVQSNSYQENSALRLSGGRLLFGTNNGMVVVDPYEASIARVTTTLTPTITDVVIDGQSVYRMDEIEGMPSSWKCLNLKNDQNSITISFSNFDYAESGSSVYQYYLEGVDKDWNPVTNKNTVSYNALQPGDYVFHLRSMGRGNKWSKERTLKIHICEPWYNMWYSWVVYLLVVAIVGYYVVRNRKEKFQLNQKMKMEKQVNDFRINFFTHVTHEFRTPLAIIQSAVSKIMDEKTGAVSRASVQTAVRGTKRLSRLVTQLMEFRKINSDGLRLQVLAGVDIVDFVRNIYQDFWYAAKQKDIVMNYQIFNKKYEMTFDRHIVETVVYNLLSNAVKYTPARGEVNVRINADVAQNVLCIIVSDSGAGISEEQKKSLFQPFMHGYVSQGGMGIGLYVAKMMAETHHGSLAYRKSEKLGGAEFIFSIPLSDDGYTSEEYLDTMALADNQTAQKDEQQLEDIREMLPEALNNVTVAVIEDDPDMLDQIRSELAVFFKVVTYSNGKQGLEGVLAEKPALLVCDVMLPDMNGYDIVKQIKNQPDGYALPVIMLTALNDEKHQIKGYKAGADDYMVKPCNFNLLVARIIQLITWSQNLPKASGFVQAGGDASSSSSSSLSPSSSSSSSSTSSSSSAVSAFSGSGTSAKVEGVTNSLVPPAAKIVEGVVDKNFLKSFESFVAQNLSDPSFTIDSLTEMMRMGRTKLYGKVKELMGETPNKYIMRQRMKKASELLLTGDYNVTDVCYMVGLEDISYFNKCFKSYYGVSPSKYGK